MKSMMFIVIGVALCVAFALVGFLIPHVQAFPYLTIALACTTGMLCLGGILRCFLYGQP